MLKKVKGSLPEIYYIKFFDFIMYCNHAYVIESVDYKQLETAGGQAISITLHNPQNTKIDAEKYPKVSPLLLNHCATKIVVL